MAFFDQPTRDEMRGVARDGEADSLSGQDDRGVHADDFARAVQQRTAGIPGIQRRIGLDDLVHQSARLRAHGAPERTDDSGGHSLLESIGGTNRDRDLSHANPRRVGEARMLNIRRVDSNDRQVRLRIGPDQTRRKDARIVERYLELTRAVDHVAVCQDESIARNDESRTAALATLATEHANVHHRRCDTIDDGCDRSGIRIQKLFVVVFLAP